jgi:ANTAR domain
MVDFSYQIPADRGPQAAMNNVAELQIKGDDAFTVLTRASQQTNTKLRDVAAELVQPARYPVEIDAPGS